MYKRFIKTITVAVFLVFALTMPGQAHAALSDWKMGANVKPMSTTDFASDQMNQSLEQLRNAGANYAILIIPYYQANRESTDLRPGWNTPTDEALISAINKAHSLGLKVMLMPHLETDYIEWRGNISPAIEDRPAWFREYTDMLLHYAHIAEAHDVEDFALGAELIKMTNPFYDSEAESRWEQVISEVREVYSGPVTYSANREFEVEVIEFWDKLDYVGLSAYYDLYHSENGTVDELVHSWDNWRKGVVEPLRNQIGKDIVITELGYRSIDGTHRNPWDWGRDGNYNEQAQANAYEATIKYWKDVPWIKGVMWWYWETSVTPANSGNKDYTPQNKLAENVMKHYFLKERPPIVAEDPRVIYSSEQILAPESTLDIWWPGEGVWVGGLQPFKAMISYSDISKYEMYWQVDGDVHNKMYDSYEDYPHKEAWVDLTNWNWKGSGPYNINFIVKDKTGKVVIEKSVNIMVGN